MFVNMRSWNHRSPLNVALRLVLAVACLFPFASPRAFAGVLVSQSDREQRSNSPFDEDDENERSGEELRDAVPRTERRPDLRVLPSMRLTMPHSAYPSGHRRTSQVHSIAEDPFRNGLGTPYRC